VILSLLTLRGLRISELCALERGLVNLGVGVIQTSRSKTAAGYREIDIIFAALHQDLAEHLARPTAFGRSRDPLVPSGNGNRLVASNIRQRVVAKVVAEANELLRERGVPEIVERTPHTLRRARRRVARPGRIWAPRVAGPGQPPASTASRTLSAATTEGCRRSAGRPAERGR
jgi:integrase